MDLCFFKVVGKKGQKMSLSRDRVVCGNVTNFNCFGVIESVRKLLDFLYNDTMLLLRIRLLGIAINIYGGVLQIKFCLAVCTRRDDYLSRIVRSTTDRKVNARTSHPCKLRVWLNSQIAHFLSQLQSFRVSVAKLLSEPICTPDYEIISRLQKMVAAHRDFTMLSRRYDEPLETSPSRCTRYF